MTNYTTISVSEELKSEMDGLKEYEEQSYEKLIWKMIDGKELQTQIDGLALDGVVFDDEAQEMHEKLNRLEELVKETTDSVQKVDRKVEDLR